MHIESLVKSRERNQSSSRTGIIALMVFASLSCATTAPSPAPNLSQDVRDAIALCIGGLSVSNERALTLEMVDRRANLISTAEANERGVSAFQFGTLTGRYAVEMYNTFVGCVNQHRSPEGSQSGPTEEDRLAETRGMSIQFPVVDNGVEVTSCSPDTRSAFRMAYTCTLRNTTARMRSCAFTPTCVSAPSGEIVRTFGSDPGIRTLASRAVTQVSGYVRCDIMNTDLTVAVSLACEPF